MANTKMWLRVAAYGVLLGAGTLALQWLDYQRLARVHSQDLLIFCIALGFLIIGILVGMRLFARPESLEFDGNPQAKVQLKISEREMEVLRAIADGHSNKEIAARLFVSPNTVKTHISRLFEKLGANRRTEALRRARELGIVP